MEVELLVNIIILSVVGTFCIIVIAVRIYVSCCTPPYQPDQYIDPAEIIAPQIQLKQQQLQWTQVDTKLDRKQDCSICLDKRVDTLTSCNHVFHMNCLIQWKRRMKNQCPYCKSEALNQITFYCQHCNKSKFIYNFQSPLIYQRNHMVPKFFTQLSANQKRLFCPPCKQIYSQNHYQCLTRNLSSVQGTSQGLNSNKTSRNRDPVEISIKTNNTPKQSRQKTSYGSSTGTPNEVIEPMGPITDDRLKITIDY